MPPALRSLTALAVTAVTLTGGAACSQAAPGHMMYGYATIDQVVLMDGERELARIDRDMGLRSDPDKSEAAWTADGKYFAFFSIPQYFLLDSLGNDVGMDKQSLTVVNTSGHIAVYPCPNCFRLVAVGNTFWAEGNTRAQIERLDPAATNAAFTRVNLPGVPLMTVTLPELLGGVDNAGLIAQTFDSGAVDNRERRRLFFAAPDRSATLVGDYRTIGRIRAAVATSSADKGQVLLSSYPGGGMCNAHATLWTLTTQMPQLAKTDNSAMITAGATPEFGMRLNGPWWGADGHFHVAASTWACGESNGVTSQADMISNIQPWKMFRLDGSKWVSENIEATSAQPLGGDTILIHQTATCAGGKKLNEQPGIPDRTPSDLACKSGPLILQTGAERKQISPAAIAVWAQPPTD